MKRFLSVLLGATMVLSFTACNDAKPSLEEVEKAISEGTVTIEDALEKEWITQEWVAEQKEKSVVPAVSKMQSNLMGEFTATTVSGETFTHEEMSDVTYVAFLNPETESGKEAYEVIATTYEQVVENGGDILVVTLKEDTTELFKEAAFPVIVYDENIEAALGTLADMVDDEDLIGSWNVNGAFLSAWNTKIEAGSLVESAADFAEMANSDQEQQMETTVIR